MTELQDILDLIKKGMLTSDEIKDEELKAKVKHIEQEG